MKSTNWMKTTHSLSIFLQSLRALMVHLSSLIKILNILLNVHIREKQCLLCMLMLQTIPLFPLILACMWYEKSTLGLGTNNKGTIYYTSSCIVSSKEHSLFNWVCFGPSIIIIIHRPSQKDLTICLFEKESTLWQRNKEFREHMAQVQTYNCKLL